MIEWSGLNGLRSMSYALQCIGEEFFMNITLPLIRYFAATPRSSLALKSSELRF